MIVNHGDLTQNARSWKLLTGNETLSETLKLNIHKLAVRKRMFEENVQNL